MKKEAEVNLVEAEFQEKKEEYKERIAKCKQHEEELKKKQQAVSDFQFICLFINYCSGFCKQIKAG